MIINDNELGSANKVPRLLDLADYAHWKDRFETHINGTDTNLWAKIEREYERPLLSGTGGVIPVDGMNVDQRKEYDNEKKAYWMLSQAIPRDIFHQFIGHNTSYSLWKALKDRAEGKTSSWFIHVLFKC